MVDAGEGADSALVVFWGFDFWGASRGERDARGGKKDTALQSREKTSLTIWGVVSECLLVSLEFDGQALLPYQRTSCPCSPLQAGGPSRCSSRKEKKIVENKFFVGVESGSKW